MCQRSFGPAALLPFQNLLCTVNGICKEAKKKKELFLAMTRLHAILKLSLSNISVPEHFLLYKFSCIIECLPPAFSLYGLIRV